MKNSALRKTEPSRTVAIIQARMRSERLPGKVLADIGGQPMLWHIIERVRQVGSIDEIVVATSDVREDDAIESFCKMNSVSCFRGSESDVLDRFYQAAVAHGADAIVRITADCPLLDPKVVALVISKFQQSGCDYVSNTQKRTYPDGLDVEIFSFNALSEVWKSAKRPSDREHVTPYLTLSNRFKTLDVESGNAEVLSSLRWTVDEPEDLEFVRKVYGFLEHDKKAGTDKILQIVKKHPELQAINAGNVINEGYYRSMYRQMARTDAKDIKVTESKKWLERSKKTIPGCAQTFSKSFSQYVQGASPVFLMKGKGCRVWDVDGNEFIDYVQGLLPNILGYANDEVNAAVIQQISQGHSFSLAHPLEVTLAERLTSLIPCAEMVRFAKNGSDATAGAVRAARAHTNRDRVAVCGYHGWQDWYIGSTVRNAGVPKVVRELTHTFPYNDMASLKALLDSHPKEFAAIIMEPVNFVEPNPGYLKAVRELATTHGVVLIFDEICSGFHFGLGGAQKFYGVTPDLACFGKAMGNGFPISCVVGRADIMKVFEEIFFSTTFGGEVAAMAAALKVLDILENTSALSDMLENGRILKDGFNSFAQEAGLQNRYQCLGNPRWSLIKFKDAAGKDSYLERSLFQQEATKRGVLLLATHNMTSCHDRAVIEKTLEVYAAVFKNLAQWLSDSNPSKHLKGTAIQPVFRIR